MRFWFIWDVTLCAILTSKEKIHFLTNWPLARTGTECAWQLPPNLTIQKAAVSHSVYCSISMMCTKKGIFFSQIKNWYCLICACNSNFNFVLYCTKFSQSDFCWLEWTAHEKKAFYNAHSFCFLWWEKQHVAKTINASRFNVIFEWNFLNRSANIKLS